VIGPSLSLEIPIFDPGHADFARLRAHLRRAQHQLEHTAIVARSGVRTHRARLHTAGRTVDYIRDTVLPRQEAIGGRALERYNGMLIGTYELLELRERKARAHQAYVEARRDYFIAHAELERAVGGRLPPGPGR
jgi:cobalt-zinc-cadmium efflux system outer membrane protein